VATGLPPSSSLSREFMGDRAGLVETIVPVVRVDDYLAGRGIHGVRLVKVDTETTEPDVLRSMTNTIRRDRPLIICEVLAGGGTESALDTFVEESRYRAFLLTPQGPVPASRIVGHPAWLNYLFAPVEAGALDELNC